MRKGWVRPRSRSAGGRLAAATALTAALTVGWSAIAARVAVGGNNPVASINIGSVSGAPGDVVQVPVTLDLLTAPPESVIGIENEINFEPATPIIPAVLGQGAACAVNGASVATARVFIPTGCDYAAGACTGTDTLIEYKDPVADGALLYTCTIAISSDAAPGSYPLMNGNPSVLTSGQQQRPTAGGDGMVTVTQPVLACVGDCAGNGAVTVDELVLGVNIDLGASNLDTCPAFDRDGDGAVVVSELIQGVNSVLDGCVTDALSCERAASRALRTCVDTASEAERGCYLDGGAACAPDDGALTSALDAIVAGVANGCHDDAAVQAAGYGPASTREGLVRRLQSACRAEPASLAARSFGGPQGAGLAAGTAAARTCLSDAHRTGARLLSDSLALYDQCLDAEHSGGSCDAALVAAQAAALRDQAAAELAAECTLEELVAVDAATYAARGAAQARCLTALAHPDRSPLGLDCGPRDGLADTPRGEYVQVVLDEATYGTRCGDGSPFAFWVRLAPEGSPVENVVVGMQGGGVCIFGSDCATRPADLFEAMSDRPETGGPLSNDPSISPFADWTKVYLPYCNQDVFIGGGTTSNFPEITVHRYGSVNVRAAMRYVRDVLWRELHRTTEDGYRPDQFRVLFGGFSAGGFGTLYNYHWVLDDLQWVHTAAYPDASLALDNGETLGVANLGLLLISDAPPLGWGARNYLPPYCFASNCGVGPILLTATSPRLKAVPEQQFLILSNQVDDTQVGTTFFSSRVDWINAMRTAYCATRELPGVQYFMPAITDSVHVISARNELYTARAVNGVTMRDWLASGFDAPDAVTDEVEEGTLVDDYPGVMPFDCPVAP